jgi:hypothetical protein
MGKKAFMPLDDNCTGCGVLVPRQQAGYIVFDEDSGRYKRQCVPCHVKEKKPRRDCVPGRTEIPDTSSTLPCS